MCMPWCHEYSKNHVELNGCFWKKKKSIGKIGKWFILKCSVSNSEWNTNRILFSMNWMAADRKLDIFAHQSETPKKKPSDENETSVFFKCAFDIKLMYITKNSVLFHIFTIYYTFFCVFYFDGRQYQVFFLKIF